MSVTLMKWSYSKEVLNMGLSTRDLAVLRALCWKQYDISKDKHTCYPAGVTIEKMTGLKHSAVDLAKKSLRDKGLLKWHNRTKKGKKISNSYEVVTDGHIHNMEVKDAHNMAIIKKDKSLSNLKYSLIVKCPKAEVRSSSLSSIKQDADYDATSPSVSAYDLFVSRHKKLGNWGINLAWPIVQVVNSDEAELLAAFLSVKEIDYFSREIREVFEDVGRKIISQSGVFSAPINYLLTACLSRISKQESFRSASKALITRVKKFAEKYHLSFSISEECEYNTKDAVSVLQGKGLQVGVFGHELSEEEANQMYPGFEKDDIPLAAFIINNVASVITQKDDIDSLVELLRIPGVFVLMGIEPSLLVSRINGRIIKGSLKAENIARYYLQSFINAILSEHRKDALNDRGFNIKEIEDFCYKYNLKFALDE